VRKLALVLLIACAAGGIASLRASGVEDATDPARNGSLPCEELSTQGGVARAAHGIVHVANVCGFVGTDVELQSRKDTRGKVHDYAFVGTMGAGLRIFDVTDRTHPAAAGGYLDSGWENDVQVRGNLAVATFDGVNGEDSSASTCLKTRYPTAHGQGIDLYKLVFDPVSATFDMRLIGCIANPPGGAHNASINPRGDWLAISNCCSDWSMDIVDLRPIARGGEPVLRYRFIDDLHAGTTATTGDARCPASGVPTCISMRGPDGGIAVGSWRPHDIFYSSDGGTAYVAAINSTWIVDVSRVLSGEMKTISIIPNVSSGTVDDPRNISISHQADVSRDGKILIVSDERGGGLTETGCNTDAGGVIGGLHFFALAPIANEPATAAASLANPVKLGDYFIPNPTMTPDPLSPALAKLPRLERACTAHVFRLGGNGSTSAGPIQRGYDGVSTLGRRQLSEAWYGAGVWAIDFSGRSSNTDGTKEDPRSTWGNTIAWNVMPGADTWSAKEYKGGVFAGDIVRGFDVYRYAGCDGLTCTGSTGVTFEVDPLDSVLVDPVTGALP